MGFTTPPKQSPDSDNLQQEEKEYAPMRPFLRPPLENKFLALIKEEINMTTMKRGKYQKKVERPMP